MKKTDDFASFTEAAVCMINTYGGNMESEEEVNTVLDKLHRILLHRENARLYHTYTTELTPEEQYVYNTILESGEKRDTV